MPNLLTNTSFGVLRTNPKLTTNVKLLYNGENLYLESFNANPQLANAAYKNFKISGRGMYDHDVYRFYNAGVSTPTEIAYDVFEEFDETSILSSFGNQYEMMYNMGVRSIESEAYDEEMGLLFPLWLNKNNIPNYFVIFRLDGPTAVNYDNIATETNNRTDFANNILKNATIVKTFDLTENSLLGSYLRRYVNQKGFPVSPIYATWNENEPWEWCGISFKKGGFSKGSNFVYEDLITKDASLIENEYYITQGFERNGIICANLINLEFLFTDDNVENYTINRYFGFYVNKLDEAWFDINGTNMFKCSDYRQTPRFDEEASKITKNLEETIIVENPSGVLLSIDTADSSSIRENGDFLSSDEVNERNSLFYVQDRLNNFHSIKKSDEKEWEDGQIRLKETKVDISQFTGFKKPDTFAKCKVIDNPGVASACIEILGEIKDYFSIEFADASYIGYDWEDEHGQNTHSLIFSENIVDKTKDEDDPDYIKYTHIYNQVYGRKAGEPYPTEENKIFTEGSNCYQYFCLSGSPENVAKAIANAINIGIDEDHRFFKAETVKNRVFVRAKFAGERMNALRMRVNNLDESSIKIYYTKDNSNIAKFVGGTTDPSSMLRIDKNDSFRFKEGLYVKTRNGYAKILGHLPYTEVPEYDDNGNIVNYKGIDEYETIFCDAGHIEVPNNNVIALYEDFKNSIGRFAFFPVKDFDFDIYDDTYKACYDLLEEIKFYTTENEHNKGVNNNPDIMNFYVEGFSVLKNLDFKNFDGNEYDRLEEKYIKELATVSKVVPHINKWVYYNEGKNVRDTAYRLNSNFAFGQYNFAPSTYYDERDAEAFSHEWYYILGIPSYYKDEKYDYSMYEHLHNYIQDFGTDIVEDLKDVSENKFLKYFILDNVYVENSEDEEDNNVMFTPSVKYSEFNGGDIENFAQTFFKGVKVVVKELSEELDYVNDIINVNNLSYKTNSKYNGYKFSCILTRYNEDKIFIIKNEKWKTITVVIALNYDTPEEPWCDNFDRTTLYALNSEYVDILKSVGSYSGSDEIFESSDEYDSLDKQLSDIIVYASSKENGYAIVRGSELGANITTTEDGAYNSIMFEYNGDKYVIDFNGDGQIDVDDFASTSYLYNFTMSKLVDTAGTENVKVPVHTEFEYIGTNILLFQGYKDYYRRKFSSVGFKNIFEKINSLDKNDVSYIVVNENGKINEKTDFIIELVQQTDILKSKYITTVIDENKPSTLNFNETIGYSLSIDNISLIPISRHSGYYEPAFRSCLFFADIFAKEKYNTDKNIVDLCRYNNSEFNTQNEEFALIKNFFYHKVNEENTRGILEFSNDSAFNSVYPLINEIGTAFKDEYLFDSSWDPNYFTKNLDKSLVELQHGTKSMVEKKAFFGSKYMKIPQYIVLETFVPCSEFDMFYTEYQNYENIEGHYMHNEKDTSIEFYVFLKKRLVEYLSEQMKDYFVEHIKPEYSYNNVESIDDDVKSYIENNILKLYKRSDVYFFTKDTRENIPYVYETTMLTNDMKLKSDLQVNTVVSIKDMNNNPFDFTITFNKKNGYSEYFGISVVLTKK